MPRDPQTPGAGQGELGGENNMYLRDARKPGLKAASVAGPTEYGPWQKYDFGARGDWDIVATDFGGIADKMGC